MNESMPHHAASKPGGALFFTENTHAHAPDAHAASAQVAQPQDALPIRHHHHAHALLWQRSQRGEEAAAVGGAQVEAIRAGVDAVEPVRRAGGRGVGLGGQRKAGGRHASGAMERWRCSARSRSQLTLGTRRRRWVYKRRAESPRCAPAAGGRRARAARCKSREEREGGQSCWSMAAGRPPVANVCPLGDHMGGSSVNRLPTGPKSPAPSVPCTWMV